MDYRELMKRYMKALRDIEGTDFTDMVADQATVEGDFTEQELAELENLSDEPMELNFG